MTDADAAPAAWKTQQAETWKLSLACSRADAERLSEPVPAIEAIDPPPVLLVSEPDAARPDAWQLDVYFEGRPTPAALALVQGLVPGGSDAVAELVADRDWVTLSQAWLEPIRAGRFHIHTAAHASDIPAGVIAFHIEASRAFGTGHHETTAGCLEMLDRMANEGIVPDRIADIGTGTGLLAFAARALWRTARIIATDIDPISIEVTAANMVANAIPFDAITLALADGIDHPAAAATAPFDLLIANILAAPLIALAPDFARKMAPGGMILLAGLLASQAEAVANTYCSEGFDLHARIDRGDWAILMLVRAP